MNDERPLAGMNTVPWQQDRRSPPEPALGRRIWLITFTDLVSLMLAFFVMLFAMSGVKVEVWQAAVSSLSRTIAPSRIPPPAPVAAYNVQTTEQVPALDLDYLATLLERIRRDSSTMMKSRLVRMPDALVLVLDADDIFNDDGEVLSPAAVPMLSDVAGILGNVSNRIGLRFHAPPEERLEAGRGSAWEPALVRAAALANGLRAAGYPRAVVAYAVTGGDLLSSGGTAGPARDERSTQIEIVILAEEADER